MAANLLRMDAVTLVAAAQTKDEELAQTVLDRHHDNTDFTRAVADVAALLAGNGSESKHIAGYLDFIGSTNGNAKQPRA